MKFNDCEVFETRENIRYTANEIFSVRKKVEEFSKGQKIFQIYKDYSNLQQKRNNSQRLSSLEVKIENTVKKSEEKETIIIKNVSISSMDH